ncbi:uncharacterized protein angptl8 [Cololabis saira]|uniref:uncharacterized protein angptl8 n=1 Tax=Cololabis saira TaxID=129043 RepID=UPI002AD2D6E2|nr:uncharacterized protein angptl8 [Cololabis saira]
MAIKLIWSLFLLCVAGSLRAAHAGPIRNSPPQEEINVLMYGAIQLIGSLSHVYETTSAKMDKIHQTLKNHEETLQNLEKQAEQAAEVEKEIKEVIQLLQDETTNQQTQTLKAKQQLNTIEKNEAELKTKVKKVEMYMNNSVPAIKELQGEAEEHSSILQGLQLLSDFHKELIETQNEKLSKLEEMVIHLFQKFMFSDDNHFL